MLNAIFGVLQHYPPDGRHRYADPSGPFRGRGILLFPIFRSLAHVAEKPARWSLDYFAETDCSVGLPKTLRQPSLRLARRLRMQAVIRSTFGISDEQSRMTSPVQIRR